ncbi:Hypothetical protein, putative, partial [Bodo saltans]
NERFARDDRERPGWRLSGPMYGVCAATSERRRELMNQCITKINEAYSTTFALMAEAFRVYVGTPFFSETAQTITQAAWGGDTWSASHMTTTTPTIAHHHPLHTTTPRPVTLLPQQHQQPSSHLYATGLPQHPPPSYPSPLWYPTPHDNTNDDNEFPTTVNPVTTKTTLAAHPSAPVATVISGVNWSSSSASVVVVAPAQQQVIISNSCLHPPTAQHVDASSSLSLYQAVDPVVAVVSPAVVPTAAGSSCSSATAPSSRRVVPTSACVFVASSDEVVVSAAKEVLAFLDPSKSLLLITPRSGHLVKNGSTVVDIALTTKAGSHFFDDAQAAHCLTLAEDMILSCCGAGPYALELPVTSLLKRFLKRGSKGHAERLSLACSCLLNHEVLELVPPPLDGDFNLLLTSATVVTLSVIIRGMKGRNLAQRVETVIVPALKECLTCEPLDNIAVNVTLFNMVVEETVIVPALKECLTCEPLDNIAVNVTLFNMVVEQHRVCVLSKDVDGNDEVESAVVMGRAEARKQLCEDLAL